MRAFASFILLLAAIPILIFLSAQFPNPDLTGAISLESAYYDSAGAKDAMLASITLGAQQGKTEYFTRLAAEDESADLAKIVREKVHSRLSALSNSLPSGTILWCGQFTIETLSETAARSELQSSPALCQNCQPLPSEECADYIQVDPVLMQVWLEKPSEMQLAGVSGGIGLSSCWQGICQSAFIPSSKRVDFR